MALLSGSKLGPYEIVSLAGAGGMGEVYRAKDTRLSREVAVKVLPAAFSADPDRVSRFEQEARAAGKLNHPNILTIYDIGTQDGTIYLVSEFLEGESLRTWMDDKAIPLRKATELASQIARGLAAAHEKGIVHRDLKPENIFVTRDGRVKILDFGLAKLTQPEISDGKLTQLPTTPGTEPGMVLGTVGYMSPEQVRGKPADYRSDIFAFGVILYEMLSGKRAFHKETAADSMSAILHQDPSDLTESHPNMTPTTQRIVQHCLEKNPENRFQSMQDVAFNLETLSNASGISPASIATAPQRAKIRQWLHLSLTLLLAAATLLFLIERFRPHPQSASMVRALIAPPENSSFEPFSELGMALSPDGKYQAFVASNEGRRQLWIRPLSEVSASVLPGTEGATYPFWSPDSRFIGFFAGGKLKKIEISGAPPQTLCDAPQARGGTWNSDGIILFAPSTNAVIYQVQSSGGEPSPVTKLAPNQRGDQRWPSFLPDGKHYLYVRNVAKELWIGELGSQESNLLIKGSSNAAYVSPGYLLFSRSGSLMAQPFDAKENRLNGEAFPVIPEKISHYGPKSLAGFSVSTNHILSYIPETTTPTQLIWVDRSGRKILSVGEKGYYQSPRVSPDGRRIALIQVDPNTITGDIWVYDIEHQSMSRFTFKPSQYWTPIWSPDGSSIFFVSSDLPEYGIYQKSATGSGSDKVITKKVVWERPTDCSSDGKFIAYYEQSGATGNDLWILPLQGGKAFPYMETPFEEWDGQFSPDTKWIAYTSNESGRREVYVQSFPAGNGKWQVSTGGGLYPRWRSDGKELFYSTLDGTLMAVNIQISPNFTMGSATSLFMLPKGAPYAESDDVTLYDISPDGQRFLLNAPTEKEKPSFITLVLNWTEALHKSQ